MKIPLYPKEIHDMTDTALDVVSTSSTTADASPIVLAQTDLLRYKFVPTLVDNTKDPQKSVSGKLVYEKKRKNEDLFPTESFDKQKKLSRGSVKVGDWMELQLSTSETYELYRGLEQLYLLHENIGKVPYGSATYARVDSSFRQFLSIIQNDPSAARMIGDKENYELVRILLQLITQAESHDSLKRSLSELQEDNLRQLATTLNIEKLKRVADLMNSNLENDDEEFWQSHVFKENQWLLAQIFSCPCTIFEEKAYVGGKSMNNRGGNVCDFIYQNSLSQNVALIEIKTPCTELLGHKYRGTYSLSNELSGAVNQVLNYRDSLTKSYYELCRQGDKPFEVLSTKCVVVIGKIGTLAPAQISAFENFRNSLNNVVIITFDELHRKVLDLIAVLAEENDADTNSEPCEE